MKNKFIKKYRTYLIALVVVVVFLGLRLLIIRQPEEKLIYIIHKGKLSETVKITGTYTAASQTQVFSPTNGIISELYVSNQGFVQKGDPLFHVESTSTDEQRATAYTAYQQALTALQSAKQATETTDVSMWAKHKALIDAENSLNFMNTQLSESKDNPATKEPYTQLEIESIKSAATKAKKEFESVETQYKQTNQNIASAQALVNSTKLNYDATQSKTVYSPATGKVLNLLKNIGDDTGNQDNNKPILLVTNLKYPAITAKVSEIDVARLKQGQTAQIVFDADKKTNFKGVIKAIDTIGTTTTGITTYDVRIELIDFSSSVIKPGMTAEITINTYSKKGVLYVPNSAILYQDKQAYLKKANKREELVKVNLGYQGLVQTEIVNELPEGLEILTVAN